jgi:CheY-like chemotaxis protein
MEKTLPTVLVIEDERPLATAIKLKLERSGFDVVTARTASQAITYLEDISRIDIIWVDHYLLGKETGLDLVAQLKTHKEWRKIPTFVVSNTASPDKVQSYIRLGVNKYYTKANFRLDRIIDDLKSSLKSKNKKARDVSPDEG